MCHAKANISRARALILRTYQIVSSEKLVHVIISAEQKSIK